MNKKFLQLAFVIIVAAAFHGNVSGQEQKIKKQNLPHPILTAFEKSYPAAKITGCSKEKEKGKLVYEIESTDGKTHRDVSYDATGKVLVIEESMSFDDVPSTVRNALSKDHPKATVLKSEKVTEDAKTKFEFIVNEGKKKHEIVYGPDGKSLK